MYWWLSKCGGRIFAGVGIVCMRACMWVCVCACFFFPPLSLRTRSSLEKIRLFPWFDLPWLVWLTGAAGEFQEAWVSAGSIVSFRLMSFKILTAHRITEFLVILGCCSCILLERKDHFLAAELYCSPDLTCGAFFFLDPTTRISWTPFMGMCHSFIPNMVICPAGFIACKIIPEIVYPSN